MRDLPGDVEVLLTPGAVTLHTGARRRLALMALVLTDVTPLQEEGREHPDRHPE